LALCKASVRGYTANYTKLRSRFLTEHDVHALEAYTLGLQCIVPKDAKLGKAPAGDLRAWSSRFLAELYFETVGSSRWAALRHVRSPPQDVTANFIRAVLRRIGTIMYRAA
jgi:hypothetical protein